MNSWRWIITAIMAVSVAAQGVGLETEQTSAPVEKTDVFVAGESGYACFRIPSLIVTQQKTILAFCEGRRKSCSDTGHIDTVLRRSRDGGKTWDALRIILGDGANTWGNPTAVVDASTGRIWLASVRNLGSDHEKEIKDGTSSDTRRAFISSSDNDGETWTPPREITSDVKLPHWRWYATGPCHAIQLKSGRLLIPANHSDHSTSESHPFRSHVIVSDDHGKTWRIGGIMGERTNESTAAELEDGQVYLNMRSYHGKNLRAVALSKDGGDTFGPVTFDPVLIEPVCQGSVLRHAGSDGRTCFVFSNPASKKREKLTVRVSHDSCKTWSISRLLYPGKCGYSDLCSITPKEVGCLYEYDPGAKGSRGIAFARMPLQWLLDGENKGTNK